MDPYENRNLSFPSHPSQATLEESSSDHYIDQSSRPEMAQMMPGMMNNYVYDQGDITDQNVYHFAPHISNMHPQSFQSEGDISQYSLADSRADHYDYNNNAGPGILTMRQTNRYIPLTPQGNLVIDIPVADKVLKFAGYKTGEFTYTRYTAITCGANDFADKGYVLRQQESGRNTEIFIVVTMYNEDHLLFCKTMVALMKNIRYLCSLDSNIWGKDGWKKVVVCIVADGRNKINRKVLDILGIMGVYLDGIMKDSVNDNPVVAHMFEYTTQMCISQDREKELRVRGFESGFFPMQILFCLKEKNAKKV
jgi:chitin synthase